MNLIPRTLLRRRSLADLTVAVLLISLAAGAAGCRFLPASRKNAGSELLKTHEQTLATIRGSELLACVSELSGGTYKGRRAGSTGGRQAADYIAAQFKAIGLEPLNGSSYFQEFPVRYTMPETAPVARVFDSAGKEVANLKYGRDIAYSIWSDSAAFTRAPIVMLGAGFGVEWQADLTGKVALVLRAGRGNGTLMDPIRAAKRQGALAVIVAGFTAEQISDMWANEDYEPGIAALGVSAGAGDTLLRQTGKGVMDWTRQAQVAVDQGQDFAPIDTGLTLSLTWKIDNDAQRLARNVIGVIPGAFGLDGGRSILLTAHYDHLGGAPGGPFWPGAWDNASGTAVMLGAARALAQADPAANIIVAAWDAEEDGLVGSAYYSTHPLVPLSSTLSVVNLDCVGTRSDFRLERDQAGPVTDALLSVAPALGLKMTTATVQPWSDAASFTSSKGVEACQVFDAGDPYASPILHDPSDTADQVNADYMERLTKAVTAAILSVSREAAKR